MVARLVTVHALQSVSPVFLDLLHTLLVDIGVTSILQVPPIMPIFENYRLCVGLKLTKAGRTAPVCDRTPVFARRPEHRHPKGQSARPVRRNGWLSIPNCG